MMCAWQALLMILPQQMRHQVDELGREALQELRLRVNAPPELVTHSGSRWLDKNVVADDIHYCVNAASRYSPWAADTVRMGYITAPGGHRIGLCGDAVVKEGRLTAIREITSVCIRVARDFPGIAGGLADNPSSVLILGPPGWGKTTLLRDLARKISENKTVAVIDERGELFPPGIPRGRRMDILTGCPKPEGIDTLLRTMGPEYIAVDEITAIKDGQALLQATGCGVKLLATAHAGSLEDFQKRSIYRSIWEQKIFDVFAVLNRDKSFRVERSHG